MFKWQPCGRICRVYNQLKQYQIQVYEETGGEYGGGWMIKIFLTEEEKKIGKLEILLLESNYEFNIERANAIDNKWYDDHRY